jgi:cob(I)alamin adenosyltransferase
VEQKTMVKIDKVYTRGGDRGKTSLVGGKRVSKDHPRVDAYGTLDELNCILGVVRCFNAREEKTVRREKLDLCLNSIQNRIFDLGGELATPQEKSRAGKKRKPPAVVESNIQWLERWTDAMRAELTPLQSFVLPGGGPVSAFLNQARTVCRRAERLVVRLSQKEAVGEWVVPYLNRLSDCLFVCGRWAVGDTEELWVPGQPDPTNWQWR